MYGQPAPAVPDSNKAASIIISSAASPSGRAWPTPKDRNDEPSCRRSWPRRPCHFHDAGLAEIPGILDSVLKLSLCSLRSFAIFRAIVRENGTYSGVEGGARKYRFVSKGHAGQMSFERSATEIA